MKKQRQYRSWQGKSPKQVENAVKIVFLSIAGGLFLLAVSGIAALIHLFITGQL
jgi:hypothetical protein|tara:strand:+ start:2144 stop:2305 length:162 start_codon:yes stop_codon:yes gene_type:complete